MPHCVDLGCEYITAVLLFQTVWLHLVVDSGTVMVRLENLAPAQQDGFSLLYTIIVIYCLYNGYRLS